MQIPLKKNVLDLTSTNEKWESKIKNIYDRDYPTDNVYERPISPPKKKKSITKTPKNKTKTPKKRSKISTKRRQTLTSKRILKKK